MQPGEVIGPGGQLPEEPEKPEDRSTQDNEPAAQSSPEPSVSETDNPQEPSGGWEFTDEEESVAGAPPPVQHDTVIWTASEYISHEKNASWYLVLGVAVVLAAAATYLLTQELVSSVVIVIMGAAFGAFAARKPQELSYVLDNTALRVGPRAYPYAQFKSFTVLEEGPIHSIMLMPLQRFMPPLSIYYDPSDEDKIAEALSSYLPYEDRKQDMVDRLMRKVRF